MRRSLSIPIEDALRVHVGDFDADGTPDLLVEHHTLRDVELVSDFRNASRTVTKHKIPAGPLRGTIRLDGRESLMAQDPTSERVALYAFEGQSLVRVRDAKTRLRRGGLLGPSHCPSTERFDVNLDGIPDLVALGPGSSGRCDIHGTNGTKQVWIAWGTTEETFAEPFVTRVAVPETIVGALRFGDIDGDNLVDAMVLGADMHRHYATEDAELTVYFARSPGTFDEPVTVDVPSFVKDLHIVDIDGDGDLEIVLTAGEGHRLTVIHPAPDRSFSPAVGYAPGPARTDSAYFVKFALIDLDHDGSKELLESRPEPDGGGTLILFANTGTTYEEVLRIEGAAGTPRSLLATTPSFGADAIAALVVEGPSPAGQIQLSFFEPCSGERTAMGIDDQFDAPRSSRRTAQR